MAEKLKDVLGELHTRLGSKYLLWKNHVLTFGNAYRAAHTQHTEVLGEVKKLVEKDQYEFFFQALELLTFGMTTGWMVKAVKKAREADELKHWVFEPLEDAAKALGGGIDGKIKDGIRTGLTKHDATTPAISKDPSTFQNDLEKGLNKVTSALLDTIADMQQTIGDIPVNPGGEIAFRQVWQSKPFFQVPKDFDEKEVAKEMELAMWAYWATQKLNWCNNPETVKAKLEASKKDGKLGPLMVEQAVKTGDKRCYASHTDPVGNHLVKKLGVPIWDVTEPEGTERHRHHGLTPPLDRRTGPREHSPRKVFHWGATHLTKPKKFGDPVKGVLPSTM